MNPDAAKQIPAGYLGEQSHAEFVREAYREQGREQERERIIKLLRNLRSASKKANLTGTANINAIIGLIKGEQK